MTTATIARPDVPMGWATAPMFAATTAPAYDTEPRLIRGASAAAELVQLLGRWTPDLHPADALVEPKIDGHRAVFLGGSTQRLLSREGSAMGCAAHTLPALRDLERRFGQPMMFDAEFAVPGGLKETLRAFRRNKPATAGVLWVFDAVPLAEWERGGTATPLSDRRAALATRFAGGLCSSVGMLHAAPMGADATLALARAFWRQQFEGVVVKDAAAGYTRGRSNAWLKLKQGD